MVEEDKEEYRRDIDIGDIAKLLEVVSSYTERRQSRRWSMHAFMCLANAEQHHLEAATPTYAEEQALDIIRKLERFYR